VVSGLSGQSWTLVLRLATALWSGTEVVRAAQCAFNSVWEIPYHERPGLAQQLVRSVWVLATIGAGLVFTTIVSGLIANSADGVNLGAVWVATSWPLRSTCGSSLPPCDS
jgi:membrane protein